MTTVRKGAMSDSKKLTVMIQYHGHVIYAGGNTTYRTVEVELTPEQAAKLQLRQDEDYGPMAIEAKL